MLLRRKLFEIARSSRGCFSGGHNHDPGVAVTRREKRSTATTTPERCPDQFQREKNRTQLTLGSKVERLAGLLLHRWNNDLWERVAKAVGLDDPA